MNDLINEVLTSMKSNRQRIMLTGFAIAWGMFSLVVMLGSAGGIQKGMFKSSSLDMPQYTTITTGKTSMAWNGMGTDRLVKLTLDDAEALERQRFDHVDDVFPVFSQPALASCVNDYLKTALTGCAPGYIVSQYNTILRGRDINATDLQERRKVCVLSDRLCEELFGGADPVGWRLNFDGNSFLVVGECKSRHDYSIVEAFAPISTVMAMYSPDDPALGMIQVTYSGIEDLGELQRLTSSLRGFLSPRLMCSPKDNKALVIRNDFETVIGLSKILTYMGVFVWIIGIATLITGVVGVSNIMLITVRERTRELGVRRAMGASRGSIIRLVLLESVIITAIFGYIGMMLGIGMTQLLSAVLGGVIPYFTDPTVKFSTIIGCNIILILAGIAAGYVPARRASHCKIVDALIAR